MDRYDSRLDYWRLGPRTLGCWHALILRNHRQHDRRIRGNIRWPQACQLVNIIELTKTPLYSYLLGVFFAYSLRKALALLGVLVREACTLDLETLLGLARARRLLLN